MKKKSMIMFLAVACFSQSSVVLADPLDPQVGIGGGIVVGATNPDQTPIAAKGGILYGTDSVNRDAVVINPAGYYSTQTAGAKSILIGANTAATGENSLALGTNATATHQNSVALGANSATYSATNVSNITIGGQTYTVAGNNPSNAGVVSVGDVGLEKQIQNVAAGRVSATSTDAVNGSQLYAVNNYLTQYAANTDYQLNQLDSKIGRTGALGAALAALKPIDYNPEQPTQIMAGTGTYDGKWAVAVGLAHYTRESHMFNLGFSFTDPQMSRNNMMFNFGSTWRFGGSEKNKTGTYQRNDSFVINSLQRENATLTNQVTSLNQQVEDLNQKMSNLQSEMEELKNLIKSK